MFFESYYDSALLIFVKSPQNYLVTPPLQLLDLGSSWIFQSILTKISVNRLIFSAIERKI